MRSGESEREKGRETVSWRLERLVGKTKGERKEFLKRQ